MSPAKSCVLVQTSELVVQLGIRRDQDEDKPCCTLLALGCRGYPAPIPIYEASLAEHFTGPVGEVGGVRLPLQSLHGYGSVFMYSASTSPGGGSGSSGTGSGGGASQGASSTGEVTLRLREPEDIPEEVLARLEDTTTLSISLQGDAVLRLGAASTEQDIRVVYLIQKESRKDNSLEGKRTTGYVMDA
ncbi:hypothetical protein QAD02_001612 [Eretmocerus hayati]|uniref:Uncharacterized protein n=1 Tax=Eretmocerus hayati TaxID=131215 RepID=A0ACC2NHS1_9HYME|nr:hypothetical protein QAD02_001612 [Eretmocerus hayati]